MDNDFIKDFAPHIDFSYTCFDRVVLRGYLSSLFIEGSVIKLLGNLGFKNHSNGVLKTLTDQLNSHIKKTSEKHGVNIPMAVDYIETNNLDNLAIDHDVVKNLCYYYEYDKRHRMVKKKLPGAQIVYIVYNKRDLLVATQDGNLRQNNEWLFTKYDALGRPILTGKFDNDDYLTQEDMQAYADGLNYQIL